MKDQKEIINENKENFVLSLAQKIGITANAKYIYGEPVERDGITVITVAKAVHGFGGEAVKKTLKMLRAEVEVLS